METTQLENTKYRSESIVELAKAMVKVQQALAPVTKNADNPFTKSKYATLSQIMEGCRKALSDNGVWVYQYNLPSDPSVMTLVTELIHAESGQWAASPLTIPISKHDPQTIGSLLTYMRRYGLSAAVGVVTEEDDDGNAASGTDQGKQKPRPAAKRGSEKDITPPKQADSAPEQPGIPDEQADQAGPESTPYPGYVAAALAALPRLDGVRYIVEQSAKDNQFYIKATGNVRPKSAMLQAEGFTEAKDLKLWWKKAEAPVSQAA
ncbi:ERF family protein [Desulfovibrio sp. OttesenSCG-928-M14]|nr:ERF family protein [Desulfovibrio sp. OttesenSCG-928-M14]